MPAEPNDSNARPRTVVLDDFVIELHGPAGLSANEVDTQRALVEAQIRRIVATLRGRGLVLTTDFD